MKAICLALTVFSVSPLYGAVITVDDPEFSVVSIQTAIDEAQEGDTVVVPPGSYTGTGPQSLTFGGKAIRVRSLDPNDPALVAQTVIHCPGPADDPNYAFVFRGGEGRGSVLAGLTITGGKTRPAIDCLDAGPTLFKCVIRNNAAGGMNCLNGFPRLWECLIEENRAQEGGGLYLRGGRLELRHCTFRANGAAFGGGALYMQECDAGKGDDTGIIDCSFSLNTTINQEPCERNNGGAIYMYESKAYLNRCSFRQNHTTETCRNLSIEAVQKERYGQPFKTDVYGQGGALFSDNCELSCSNCCFVGNGSGFGGAVYSYGGRGLERDRGQGLEHRFENCVFAGNQALLYGGAIIHVLHTPIRLISCTITGNRAGQLGAGLMGFDIYAVTLRNSIVFHNQDRSGWGHSMAGYSFRQPGTVFVDHVTVDHCCIQLDPNEVVLPFAEVQNTLTLDPRMLRLPNHGGDGWGDDPATVNINEGLNDDYGDLRLARGSPCIDAGLSYPWAGPNAVDFNGLPRVMGTQVDIGAHEYLIPTLTMIRPQGNPTWTAGSRQELCWTSVAVQESIDILLSTNGGSDWQVIAESVPDTGRFTWQVPESIHSQTCLIRADLAVPHPDAISIDSAVFTIQADVTDPPVSSLWPSLGGNFQRTGLSTLPGPEQACVKWACAVDGPIVSSPALGADDRIHVSTQVGKLYAINQAGEQQWIYAANVPLLSSPTIGPDGTVYVGCQDGTIRAIDRRGFLRWTFNAGAPISSSPALDSTGRIVCASQNGQLICLDSDGSKLWTYKDKRLRSFMASPAIGQDNSIYLGALYGPNLYAFDASDGSLQWQCSFDKGNGIFSSPVVGADGTIYQVLLGDSSLHAVDPGTGAILWSTDLADPYSDGFRPFFTEQVMSARGRIVDVFTPEHWSAEGWSEPVIGPDGTIYLNLDDPYLRAIGPDGAIKWIILLGSKGGFTLTVSSDGLIYAVCEDGHLYIVSPEGRVLRQLQVGKWPSYPVVMPNGALIVADSQDYSTFKVKNNAAIYAFEALCDEAE